MAAGPWNYLFDWIWSTKERTVTEEMETDAAVEANGTSENGVQNGLQWTLGDESKEESDLFYTDVDNHPPVAPSNGQGGYGLSEDETRALLEKRRRLK